MKVTARIENPDAIDVTVSVTLRVADWDNFSEQLGKAGLKANFPFWKMLQTISTATGKAKAGYYETTEAE